MKVAVCLSGQLRSFVRSRDSLFKNIIDPTDADLFVYGWDFEKRNENDVTKRFSEDGTVEEFLELYRPKSFILESCDEFLKDKSFSFRTKAPETSAERMMCMFYTNMQCYQQINNESYDVVFRCRTEIEYERPVTNEELEMSYTSLVIPKGLDGRDGYQDSFAFGSVEDMKVYNSVYNNIEHYAKNGIMIHPEYILRYHLDCNNVPFNRIDFPMLLRGKKYG